MVYESEIMSRTSRGGKRPGIEVVLGQMYDISEYVDFGFYDLVWYHKNMKTDTVEDPYSLGRWLGVLHRVGSDMCYWILTVAGKVIACTTVQHMIRSELIQPEIKKRVEEFDAKVNE